MAKYIMQLRRGTKEQWIQYEQDKPEESKPLAGELVVEYDNGVPRLKIGDGNTSYSDLPYMSVDSFVLPTHASVTLIPDAWVPVLDDNSAPISNRYFQYVTINHAIVTQNSKIDLQPNPEQLAIFHEKDITFTAINSGGNVRVCVVGQMPTDEYTIQVTVTEVAENA
jgi:hypothetical protein